MLLAAALLLTGCSAGASAWGSSQQQVAEVTNIASYSAADALAEARRHFRNSNFGHSAAFYKRAVELSPSDPQAYVGLGASYDRLRRFDLSDRVYASLYKLQGESAQYYNNLGYSYMLRGKLGEALTNFRRAEALEPGNVVVANNIQMLQSATAGRA